MASLGLKTYVDAGKAGRCRLTPDRPRVDRAWCQRLKLNCDGSAFKLCFQFQVAPLQRGAPVRGGRARQRHRQPPAAAGRAVRRGRAVQVDPIKPMLKAPEFQGLKLKCDETLSMFGFNFDLRRYTVADFATNTAVPAVMLGVQAPKAGATLVHSSAQRERFLRDRGCP